VIATRLPLDRHVIVGACPTAQMQGRLREGRSNLRAALIPWRFRCYVLLFTLVWGGPLLVLVTGYYSFLLLFATPLLPLLHGPVRRFRERRLANRGLRSHMHCAAWCCCRCLVSCCEVEQMPADARTACWHTCSPVPTDEHWQPFLKTYVFATVGTLFFSFFVGYCLALLLVVGPLTPALALLLWPCAAACGGAEYRQRHGLRKLMGKIWMFACLPVKKVLED